MLCGTFPAEEDYICGRSTSKRCRGVQKSNKNPYSSRGLDKFAMLSADLEARRRMIISQKGYPGSSLVRFVHSSRGWIPVVVKLIDDKQGKPELQDGKRKTIPKNPIVGYNSPVSFPVVEKKTQVTEMKNQPADSSSDRMVTKTFSWSVKDTQVLFNWRRPGYYGPLVLILILFCLVLYGRVFAIFCTSIWWYLVPTIKGSSVNHRSSMKKKDYGRRLSEKRMNRSATTTR